MFNNVDLLEDEEEPVPFHVQGRAETTPVKPYFWKYGPLAASRGLQSS